MPSLDAVLRGEGLRSVLQPVVDVRTGAVVAHEALLRGPEGTPWESPLALLEAAHAAGRGGELDAAAVAVHLAHAAAWSGLEPMTVFLNVEPATLSTHLDRVLAALACRPAAVQVVIEFTERALAVDPAGILAAAEQVRAAGCAVALDDVGVEPASLAFIPLLRPEVVKLDLRLLRTVEDLATITVAHAVRAYAEEAGCDVVAEGVETAADRTRAVVLGATLGQGWLWGRPDPRPRPAEHHGRRFAAAAPRAGQGLSPFDLLAPGRAEAGPKSLLLAVSRGLELAAQDSRVPPVLLSCFQRREHFGPATGRRYAGLAAVLPLVGALAVDLPREPAPGVSGARLVPGEPLAAEWTVVVLGAHEAIALIARECAPPAGDGTGERWFEFAVTHDRGMVTDAALLLVERLRGDVR